MRSGATIQTRQPLLLCKEDVGTRTAFLLPPNLTHEKWPPDVVAEILPVRPDLWPTCWPGLGFVMEVSFHHENPVAAAGVRFGHIPQEPQRETRHHDVEAGAYHLSIVSQGAHL